MGGARGGEQLLLRGVGWGVYSRCTEMPLRQLSARSNPSDKELEAIDDVGLFRERAVIEHRHERGESLLMPLVANVTCGFRYSTHLLPLGIVVQP